MTLTLAPGSTFRGVASAATSVTVTIFGDEKSEAHGNAYKILHQSQLPNVAAVLYTAPVDGLAVIAKTIIMCNTTVGAVTATLFVDGTGVGNRIGSFTIPAGGEAHWAADGWRILDSTGALSTTSTTALTGDVTGAGSGTIPTTLATVNSNVGSFGSATAVPTFTVNAKGLMTAAGTTSIQITEAQVTNLVTDLAGKQPTGNYLTALTSDVTATGPGSAPATLATVNANVGSFGTASNVGQFTINAKGLTTAAANVPIAIANTQVSGLGTLSTQNGTFSGTHSGSSSGTNTGDQNLFASVTGNSGTATADTTTDSIAITGANGVTTAATDTPDGLVITGANAFGVVTGNSGTATADTSGDSIAITGTGQASTTATDTPDGLVVAVPLLSGDISSVAGGATTLPNVNAGVGTFGDATHIPIVTANAKGQITAISSTTFTAAGNSFGVVTGNSGTANSDIPGDTLALTGTLPISTAATDTPDGVVISIAAATANTTPAVQGVSGYMTSADKTRMSSTLDAQADFGFVDDLRGVGDGTCSTGAPTKITSATMAFVASDLGKRVTLALAAAAGAEYAGTITNIDSATQITVSPSIGNTVTNKALQIGTDNTTAITALQTAVNTTYATYPGLTCHFGRSPLTGRTGRYGFPIGMTFNRPVILTGEGRGFTADTGVADQVGGTWLCWWAPTCDGGTAFGGFIAFVANQNNNMKGSGLRDLSVDCSNGSQYGTQTSVLVATNALWAVKLATVNGFSWNNVFIRNPQAIGLWCDIDSTPTEQESTSRGMISNVGFRCLDNGGGMVTTPFLMTTGAALTATPANFTVAANALQTAGYIWTETTVGRPVLCKYTGGGTTTLSLRCSTEDAILTPTTVANGNIVSAAPSNSVAAVLSGTTTANTNLSIFQMWQISHGTTWGPAAVECLNADSLMLDQIVINGGDHTNDGAINRIRKPGVRFNGHQTTLGLAARNNVFREGDAGAGGVSNMALLNTGAKMTAPAGPNYWWGYQLGNAAPQPDIELGGYLDWTANGGVTLGLRNVSQTLQTYTATTLTAVNGSVMLLPPQAFQIGGVFAWDIHMAKTAAGTAASLLNVRIGTAGTTADANVMQFSRTPTAALADGIFRVIYTITVIGGSATGVGTLTIMHSGTSAAGFANTAATIIGTPTTFNSASSGLLYISLSQTTGTAEVCTSGLTMASILRIGSQGA